jgi:alkylation response protein AidB-like acyl-CoA dehydrogenase
VILRDFALPEAAARHAELLDDLASGERLAGVAFAHVRRPGPPNPTAMRVDGGWLINGTLDWVTSWDIADVVLVMVATESSYLSFFLNGGEVPSTRPGVEVGEPLQLLAMGGTTPGLCDSITASFPTRKPFGFRTPMPGVVPMKQRPPT